MKDIELAMKRLKKENLTLVAVKNGEIIFESNERGIKPMYILATEKADLAKYASIADKVIGKGAALLCAHIGIKKVYTDLISLSAVEVFKKYGIEYEFENCCEYIKNRDQTGSCPIEAIANDIENPLILVDRLYEFLNKIGGKNEERNEQ